MKKNYLGFLMCAASLLWVAGWQCAVAKDEAPADETIRVSAAIVDLYINAPDTMSAGRSKTYTTETGSMVLVMEIRDSPSGQLLARVVDRHSDNGTGTMQWTTSVTNRAEADRAISMWASKLVDALDRLNRKGS